LLTDLNAAQHNPDPMTFMSSYQGNYNGEVLENAINHGAHSQSPPKDSWEDYTNAQLDEIWQKVAENENGEERMPELVEHQDLSSPLQQKEFSSSSAAHKWVPFIHEFDEATSASVSLHPEIKLGKN
jgi:hypothetical protein